ncbi:MAG TPA: glycosyltransferase family 4 protein [Vicinamibacterales bacterium]|nr:glycosyltransferase family 4 protein [Vicinamibacterales bacterium]
MTRWALAAGDFTPQGGMDRANHGLARYLAAAGREVHLVAHRVWPDLAALGNVTVHHVPRPLGAHMLGAPLLSRAASRVAARLGPAARLLGNGGNTRWPAPTWVHYLHAAYAPQAAAGTARRWVSAAVRRHDLAAEADAIRRAPAIICNSARTAADVRRCHDVDIARIHVVYYGVDPDQFSAVTPAARAEARAALGIAAATPLAIFIGALGDRRKGFDLLFEAWRRLCADPAWDVDLAVAGVGAEVPAWEQRAAAAGLARRITFLRFRPDIPRVLAAGDVLVHPSRYEAYGLGVHEALCRGLPVVVSAGAGVAERLPDDLKMLTLPEPVAVDDLIDRLRLWHGDIAGWRERAERTGAVLRTRTWDDMAADIAAIVEAA